MNTLAGYTDSEAVDYLDDIRKYIAQNKAGKSAAANLIPEYSVPTNSDGNVTDVVSINNNQQTPNDTLNVTDDVTRTNQNTGTFLIDTAQIDFSDVG